MLLRVIGNDLLGGLLSLGLLVLLLRLLSRRSRAIKRAEAISDARSYEHAIASLMARGLNRTEAVLAVPKIHKLPLRVSARLFLDSPAESSRRAPLIFDRELAEQAIAALLKSSPTSTRAQEIAFLQRLGVLHPDVAVQLQ